MENKMYNLTYPQKNIWLVEKYNGKSSVNLVVGTTEIKGKFNVELCKEAIDDLIKKNDILRVKIVEDNGQVYQYFEKEKKIDVPVIDMANFSEKEKNSWKEKNAQIPLDFPDTLYQFYILNYGGGNGAIFLKMHHIICDAWGSSKLTTQAIKYMERKNGNEVKEDEVFSYCEFIESENEYTNSEKVKKDEVFWKEYLADIKEPISIKNINSKTRKAKRISISLSDKETDIINKYCKENRISPYVMFLTAISTYLYRIKENNDFIIGTPVLNRSNFKEKNIVGMCVSTLPLRIKLEENEKFIDLAKSISSNTMSLFRHQKYPYTKTLEIVRENSNFKEKLYNIVLSYQNARTDMVDSSVYSTTWPFSGKLNDELQIHITDFDDTGRFVINYDYLSKLYDKKEIEYLHTRIMTIINEAISNLDINIEEIRIMGKTEENKILNIFNDTDTQYPKDKSVIEIFEQQVKEKPDSIALIYNEKSLTYKELNQKANCLAHYLKKEKNVKKGDIVAVAIDKSLELYIAILAVLKADAAYLPIDINLINSKINYMLKNSNSKLVITTNEKKYDIENINLKRIENKNNLDNPKHNLKYNDIVYVMYTSGTTGNPKGAAMYNYNVVKLVKNINYFDMNNVDVVFLAGSVGFDASMHEMWLNFLNGKKGCIISKETMLQPHKYQIMLEKYNKSIAIFTTQLFHQYVKYNPEMFRNVEYLVAGGDVLLSEYTNKLKKTCPNTKVINIYGPTECSAATTTYELNKNEKIIPIGKPISNTKCYILDSKKRLLPIGCEGELYIAGDGVGAGYINNKKATMKSFVNIDKSISAFKSGDIVRYDFNGNIYFMGREDYQIKINGYRIDIADIQNIALKYSRIKETYVNVIEKDNIKELILYIVADTTINIDNLKEYLYKNLPNYIVPKKIMQIPKMPLKLNGKVDSKKLPDYEEKSVEIVNDNENLSSIERIVMDCFKSVLNVDNIKMDSDLFELGLDSIKVAKCVILLNKKNIDNIGYQEIYDLRTIRRISKSIAGEVLIEDKIKMIEYDYSEIDKLLSQSIDKNFKTPNIDYNILITGVTGFLGAHILYEYLQNTNSDIYCIVRPKNKLPEDRIKETLSYYFDSGFYNNYKNRIKIINMDLTDKEKMVELESIVLEKNIKIIVNSAASVKHYGTRKMAYKINYGIVEKLLHLTKKTNTKFVQISTLSVSGNSFDSKFEIQKFDGYKFFDEQKLYIGQKFENVYTYTKYIAELKILEAISNGLNAKIIRIGNLTKSSLYNKNQANIDENGFIQRIRFLLERKYISENLYNKLYLEFSPVDMIAKTIFLLSNIESKNIIYHCFNNNHVTLKYFIDLINKKSKDKIKVIMNEEFEMNIKELLKSTDMLRYKVLIEDFGSNPKNDYQSSVIVQNNITNAILKKNNFSWPKVSDKYILDFVKSIKKEEE